MNFNNIKDFDYNLALIYEGDISPTREYRIFTELVHGEKHIFICNYLSDIKFDVLDLTINSAIFRDLIGRNFAIEFTSHDKRNKQMWVIHAKNGVPCMYEDYLTGEKLVFSNRLVKEMHQLASDSGILRSTVPTRMCCA
jgi:hypothetical protein